MTIKPPLGRHGEPLRPQTGRRVTSTGALNTIGPSGRSPEELPSIRRSAVATPCPRVPRARPPR
jgi:hypothetical protein